MSTTLCDLTSDLVTHLKQIKRVLRKLMAHNHDFTANIILDASFQDFEEECEQFVACHFGIPFSSKPTTKKAGKKTDS